MLPDEPTTCHSETSAEPSTRSTLAKETAVSSLITTSTARADQVLDTARSPDSVSEAKLFAPQEPPQPNGDDRLQAASKSEAGTAPENTAPEATPTAEPKPPVQLLQLPQEKIAIELHPLPTPKGFRQRVWRFSCDFARDFGALLMGLASVAVTIVIALFAQQINEKQAKSMEEQTKAAQEEVRQNFIKEFRERLGELTDKDQKDSKKKIVAAIALAQYGDRALPALKMSLAAGDKHIREGAAVVVVQMLSEKDLHSTVLSRLQNYFEEDNLALRAGVLECYTMLTPDIMTDAEFFATKNKIKQYVDPSADYSDRSQKQEVLLGAAKFFSNWPSSDSAKFLLAVAGNHTCSRSAPEQAINFLESVTKGARDLHETEREALRNEVIAELQRLLLEYTHLPKTNINATEDTDILKSNIKATIEKLQAR